MPDETKPHVDRRVIAHASSHHVSPNGRRPPQAEGAVKFPIPVLIFVVWLYGTLMLSDRVLGHVIMLLGGLVAAGMIVIHSKGGVVPKSGGFFFVWTMFALSATGWFTAILSARGLWLTLRARRSGLPAS